MLGKLLRFIKSLFGFNDASPPEDDDFEEQLRFLSSGKKVDEVNRLAFQALLHPEDFAEGKPHPYENEIRAECIKVNTAISNYYSSRLKNELGDLSYLLSVIDQDPTVLVLDHGHAAVKTKLEAKIAHNNNDAKKLKAELAEEEQALHIFKRANDLNRNPEYVDRRNAFYILAALALIEAVVNSLFLREAASFNVALLTALIFSFLNVGGNAWLGFQNRWANHIDAKKRKAGEAYKYYAAALTITIATVLCVLRLYVVPADKEVDFAFFIAETIGLFLISIALGVGAFIKGKQLDDPYPGFSDAGRKVHSLSEKLEHYRDAHAAFYDQVLGDATMKIQSLISTGSNAKQSLVSQLPQLKEIIELWRLDAEKLQSAYVNLMQSFKSIIKGNHTGIADNYPDEIVPLPENRQLNTFEERYVKISQNQADMAAKAKALIENLQAVQSDLTRWAQSPEGQALRNWP